MFCSPYRRWPSAARVVLRQPEVHRDAISLDPELRPKAEQLRESLAAHHQRAADFFVSTLGQYYGGSTLRLAQSALARQRSLQSGVAATRARSPQRAHSSSPKAVDYYDA